MRVLIALNPLNITSLASITTTGFESLWNWCHTAPWHSLSKKIYQAIINQEKKFIATTLDGVQPLQMNKRRRKEYWACGDDCKPQFEFYKEKSLLWLSLVMLPSILSNVRSNAWSHYNFLMFIRFLVIQRASS